MWKQTKPTCFYACLLFPCGWTEDFDSITNLDSVSLNYSLSTFISSRTPRAVEELCKPRQEKRSITVISFSWFAPLFWHFLCIIPSLDSGFWTAKVAEGNTMRRFCWAQMPATPSNEVSHLQAELRRDTWHLRRARDTAGATAWNKGSNGDIPPQELNRSF